MSHDDKPSAYKLTGKPCFAVFNSSDGWSCDCGKHPTVCGTMEPVSAPSATMPFDAEDKKVVDDIARKPMDAWTSMDKLALLAIACRTGGEVSADNGIAANEKREEASHFEVWMDATRAWWRQWDREEQAACSQAQIGDMMREAFEAGFNTGQSPAAPEPALAHGGRPMTLQECVDAEQPSAAPEPALAQATMRQWSQKKYENAAGNPFLPWFDEVPLPQPTASEAGELEWLHRFINCVPFGEHAPQADIDRAHRIVDALHASSPAAPEEK